MGVKHAMPPQPMDQYHHYIPRFILRRFQVGPKRSKKERQRHFRKAGVDPEYIYYWDVAKQTVDLRPIGQVYGVRNLYRDCKNLENVNVVEKTLSILERKAAAVIADLHEALPTHKFSIKRRPLEDLRKFLFIMHYRSTLLSNTYFDENHPENAPTKLWIENFRISQGLDSPSEVWLHILQYYLDNSHSWLMARAAEIMEKYGIKNFCQLVKSRGIPQDLEHYPALAYQTNCGGHYACIWEAADGEEFVLGHNSFGLWEGLVCDIPSIHRIFVISPRVVIILRSGWLTDAGVMKALSPTMMSELLWITQGPPLVTYHNGTRALYMPDGPAAMENYRASKQAEKDIFTFEIKKLSSAETMGVNVILLGNVYKDGSVTFASAACMLRTAHTYCTHPIRVMKNPRIIGLTKLLKESMMEAPETDPTKLVHFKLFKLLLDLSTGNKTFISAYDRARAVLDLLSDDVHCSSIFVSELGERSRAIEKQFLHDCNQRDLPTIKYCINTLPDDISASLFSMLFSAMESSGFIRNACGSILDTIQDEAVAIAFLDLVSVNIAAWYKLMTSDPCAASVLSQLFEEDMIVDDQVMTLVNHVVENPKRFKSGYERALFLHRTICMSGPTTNNLTIYCASAIAAIVHGLTPIVSSGRRSAVPNARLSMGIPQAHWLDLQRMVNGLMREADLSFTSGCGKVPSADIKELANDVIVVGVLIWMSTQKPDFLEQCYRPRKI